MSSPTFTAVKVKYLQFVEFLQLVNTTMGFNPIESRALNPDAEKILTYIMTLYNAQTKAIIHSNKRPSQELDFILNSIKFNTYKNTSLASALGQISHIENCDLKTTITKSEILQAKIKAGDHIKSSVIILTHSCKVLPNDWIAHVGTATCTSEMPGKDIMTISQTYNIMIPSYLRLSPDEAEHQLRAISIVKLALKSQFLSLNVEGSLQVDAHPTSGDLDQAIWIGMTLSILSGGEAFILPVFLVGGDIGCGMTAIPLVTEDGALFNTSMLTQLELEKFMIVFIKRCQTLLRRGAAVEKGEMSKYDSYSREELTQILNDVSMFATGTTLDAFLKELYCILVELNLLKPVKAGQQTATLNHILPFMGSLGSSGNHFFEILSDDSNNLIACIHSGSRGLGAKAYEAMKAKLPLLEGERCIAVNVEDVGLVSRVYDALNKFALFNRAFCYHILVKPMKLSVDVDKILKAYELLPYIQLMTAKSSQGKAVRLLAEGIIHNGVSGLSTVHEGKIYHTIVVKKGSVILNPNSIAIVANDCCSASPGCTVVTNTHNGDIREVDLHQIFSDVKEKRATLVPVHDPIFHGVISLPHGAGRDQSAVQTMKQVQLSDFTKVMQKLMAWSISPDTAGDCPGGKAYKSQNLKAYQTENIQMHGLKTLLNFKEGINISGIPKFIDFLHEFYTMNSAGIREIAEKITKGFMYEDLSPDERQLFKYVMSWDLILVYNSGKHLRVDIDHMYSAMVVAQTKLYKALKTEDVISDTFEKYVASTEGVSV